ncbi:hypothetical protein [Paraburkholderia bryophila]|uniref:Uncharacterized protein n=1 Tax=Paraburkholderia bryophila TaxID=420952 RepID=A0A7Y9WEP8_9BURK|nr:hypothetical protein [Paraburkholderia bryophila]NYH18853.1 hypothetical protein [Paraburkholderia bryophila]
MMTNEKSQPYEKLALERVVSAAREVHAASIALESHFAAKDSARPSTLQLARFAAAMQESREAREAFDKLVPDSERSPR